MVDSHLMVVAKLAEELTAVGYRVVHVARDLDRFPLLLLKEVLDVFLSARNILRAADDFDTRLAIALAGNINGNLEFCLHLALGVATTANKRAVLVGRHLENLRDLALAFGYNFLDSLNDIGDDLGTTLNLDGVTISFLLGELDGSSKLATIVRAASSDDKIPKVRT